MRVVGALVALAAIVAGGSCSREEERPTATAQPTTTVRPLARGGSEIVEDAGPLQPVESPLTYRIEYRVENFAGGDHIVSTDELIVRRPFESRLNTKAGAPPGGEVQSTNTSSFGKFETGSANSTSFATFVRPGVAGGDLRFDGALDDLAEEGVFQPRERRRVLGRECQVYRTGEPIGTGKLTKPAPREYADECIDAAGLLLEELWVTNGAPIRRKLAVTLDDQPAVDDGTFTLNAAPLAIGQQGAAVVELTPDSRPPATFWQLDQPPAGFTHRGRYRVVTAAPQMAPGAPPALASDSVVDVYLSGPRLLLIEQATVADPDDNGGDDRSRGVSVGELGDGRLTVGVLGSAVVARPDAARIVRVEGTLDPDELVRIAAALRPHPSGTLTPK